MTWLGPQQSGSQIDNQQPPPINTGGDQTSPVKNEFSADPKDADDEDLLENDLGDDVISVIDEEMRASQFDRVGPNGTAAAAACVPYATIAAKKTR